MPKVSEPVLMDSKLSRREVAAGGLLTILWSRALFGQTSVQVNGCLLEGPQADQLLSGVNDVRTYFMGNEPMIPKSGDPGFDLALAKTLSRIADQFNCFPGFAYFDDSAGENAYATPEVRSNGADGTVLFGTGLLQRMLHRLESPDACVAAVCAHEFGHILQYKHGLERTVGAGQPTVKRVELQADYFSGYFAGRRKRQKPSYPAAVYATTAHSIGDTAFGNRNHHGTPDERASAIVEGFYAGYRDQKSLAQAMSDSTDYVMTL